MSPVSRRVCQRPGNLCHHGSGRARETSPPGARVGRARVLRMRTARVRMLCAAAGVLVVLLLGAGCASQQPTSAAAGCLRVSSAALRQHRALTSVPAACGRLGKAQLASVVAAAVAAAAKHEYGKPLMRARLRTLGPLLPRLRPGTETGPAPPGPAPAGQGTGLPLDLAALAAWLVTAGLGTAMMARWIFRGGLRGARSRVGGRAAMNFAHLGLALAGLATWIGYVVTGLGALSWAGCVFLMPVTGLGMSLLLRLPVQAPVAMAAVATITPGPAPVPTLPARPGRATRGPGVLIVVVHVTFAVVTMLLTLLAAVGAG